MAYTVPDGSVVHELNANLDNHEFPPIADLTQYDCTMPVLAVKLWAGQQAYKVPEDAAASIRMRKPDGKNVYNPVLGYSEDRQTVYIGITPQMTAAAGEGKAILEIMEGAKIIGTSRVTLSIAANPVPREAIESGDEYLTAQQLASEAKAAAEEARKSAAAAKESEGKADASATEAEDWTNKSKSWAIGEGDEGRADQKTNNSKYWAEQSALHETGAQTAQGLAESAKTDAESARDLAEGYKDAAATSAQAAEKSQQGAADSATQAGLSADAADASATQADQAKTDAQAAQAAAESARDTANTAADTATSKAQEASESADNAKASADEAKAAEDGAENWSLQSKSWAVGDTGVRDGEEVDNSKYWAGQSKEDAKDADASAQKAKEEADRAQSYAQVNAPDFYLDLEDMTLYQKGGVGVDFTMDEDAALYWKISDAAA